ncbi:MAG: 30S ribosomal protein S18 [Leptospiraceae bacterium]|nr:30S ribosomal protein S18 [Leptospiraceae bacterium]MDW7977076.1 30S ribosomal protein S18 [Leptospiraceae bacterium]
MSEETKNPEIKNEPSESKEDKTVKYRFKKRVLDTRGLVIDYRNPEVLKRFITKTGKILPRRLTGATAKVQRKIAKEIKRARMANLLPFTKR